MSSSVMKSMSKKGLDKNFNKLTNELKTLCSTDNLITCFVTLAIVAYIIILNPSTVLDFFGTSIGKLISMIVFVCVLCIDVKVGILVGIAVALSIGFAHIHNTEVSIVESMQGVSMMQESFKMKATDVDDDDEEPEKPDIPEIPEEPVEQKKVVKPKIPVDDEDDDDEEFSNFSKF